MVRTSFENGWLLTLDGRTLLEHSPERPFVSAIRREKTYAVHRGTVKEQVREAERTAGLPSRSGPAPWAWSWS